MVQFSYGFLIYSALARVFLSGLLGVSQELKEWVLACKFLVSHVEVAHEDKLIPRYFHPS